MHCMGGEAREVSREGFGKSRFGRKAAFGKILGYVIGILIPPQNCDSIIQPRTCDKLYLCEMPGKQDAKKKGIRSSCVRPRYPGMWVKVAFAPRREQ